MQKTKDAGYCSKWVTIYFDGGAEPNPGPASGAAVLDFPDGDSITVAVNLGVATNNVAEYSGCIAGLRKALELGKGCVHVLGDSQLVIKQLQGKYAVKAANLRPLFLEARQLLAQFDSYQLEWIPRSQNSRADAAAGEVIAVNHSSAKPLPLSLPVCLPAEALKAKIEKLIKQGDQAGFKDFLALKSGRDEFSKLRGDILIDAVPSEIRDAIASLLRAGDDEDFTAKVYRWWLRGYNEPRHYGQALIGAQFRGGG